MIRRTTHFLASLAGGLVAGVAVAAALIAWRLALGPLSLDLLAPYLARSLAAAQGGLNVAIDHTLLSFGDDGKLELVARGVHLGERNETARLTLPEMSMSLSARAAFAGVLAPTRIVVRDPSLRLRRNVDGSFHFGLGDDAAEAEDWAGRLLHDIAGPPDRRGALGYLTQVAIRDASFHLDDRALGVRWHADRVDATLFRNAAGISGDIALAVEVGGQKTEIHADLRYRSAATTLAVALDFADLRPASVAAAAPPLAPLAVLDLPISGLLRAELDLTTLRIRDAWCDLSLRGGAVRYAKLAGGELMVEGGELRAAYDPVAGSVQIESFSLDLGGPQFTVAGSVGGLADDLLTGRQPQALDVSLDLHGREVPVDALPRLWPEELASHARVWTVEHVHDGAVDEVHASLGLHIDLPENAGPSVRVNEFAGTLAYRGLSIDYLKPLPPAREVDGTASFDRAHMDLVPTGGHVLAARVTGGAVKLFKLDTDDEQIAIDLGMRGPLRDVLEVLDTKPLQYARSLKLDPARVAGTFDARARFGFPLKHDLRFSQVDFSAEASLADVGVSRILFGRDLAAGALSMRLDRSALRLDGTVQIGGVPATLDWTQSLKAGDAVPTHYIVRASLDAAARRRLGLDFFSDMLDGTVDVDAAYAVGSRGSAEATIALDLRRARIAIPKLGWSKAAGTPAAARFALDLIDDRPTAIRDAVIKGGGMDARLAIGFTPAGDGEPAVARVDLTRLVVGETDVAGSVTRRRAGSWQAKLAGRSLDLSPLIGDLRKAPTSAAEEPPLFIDARLQRVVLGPKREARDVTAQLYSNGVRWQAATADITMTDGGKATLRFGEISGNNRFRLSTDDFGSLLRLFDVSDNVVRGQLLISGQVEDQGSRRELRGSVDGADYRVIGAPLLARLLSLASFSGIGALLSGEGIPFTRLKGDFTYADGRLAIDNLRAYGGAMGVNASGTVDLDKRVMDLSGTLVPAYTLNTVLGNIPVLGSLLLGGTGEGIFAANFRVAGPLDEPGVSVNPLSALAPGVLRKLFLFEPFNPTPESPAPAPGEGTTRPR